MPIASDRYDTVVVGAGAFGGWTALSLSRLGQRVLLLDQWGPGNSRSSSGGETRVLRSMYGGDTSYVDLVARSLGLWQQAERRWGARIFFETGALWMCPGSDEYVRVSLDAMRAAGCPVDELSINDARDQFPQISFESIRSVYLERKAGYLLAAAACRRVWAEVGETGGTVMSVQAAPGSIESGRLSDVRLNDGSCITADTFVFAAGPWLAALVPDLSRSLSISRQEVFYFGAPSGDGRFARGRLPIWIEMGPNIMYGVPDHHARGFKVGDDTRGRPMDPTRDDRIPSPEGLAAARDYIGRRFPALRNAPLVESRVCQYTNTPDGHFIVDRLPFLENVWVVGGGSGHGFKLGPVIGDDLASTIVRGGDSVSLFSYDRLRNVTGRSTQFDHLTIDR